VDDKPGKDRADAAEREGKPLVRRVLRISGGIFFLLLGIAGLVLPVLQGLLFIFIGLALLAPDVPPLRRLGRRFRKRFPRQADRLRREKKRLSKHWRSLFRRSSRERR